MKQHVAGSVLQQLHSPLTLGLDTNSLTLPTEIVPIFLAKIVLTLLTEIGPTIIILTSVIPALVGSSSSTLLKLWLLFLSRSNDNFFFSPDENEGEDGDLMNVLLLSFGDELGVLFDEPPP